MDGWLLLCGDLLNFVEADLALVAIERRRLCAHVSVDLSLPRGFRRLLRGIPFVKIGGADPDIHLPARVQVDVCEPKKTGVVIEGFGDPLDDRWKIQRNKIDPDSNL